jgi:hypothetical protein
MSHSAIGSDWSARLHVAVVEEAGDFRHLSQDTNGELEFHQIMRKMLPNGNGTTIACFGSR